MQNKKDPVSAPGIVKRCQVSTLCQVRPRMYLQLARETETTEAYRRSCRRLGAYGANAGSETRAGATCSTRSRTRPGPPTAPRRQFGRPPECLAESKYPQPSTKSERVPSARQSPQPSLQPISTSEPHRGQKTNPSSRTFHSKINGPHHPISTKKS